jgi:uncharacterized protein (TIRG00374 family)
MATTDFSLKSLASKAVWPVAAAVLLYVAVSVWVLRGRHELASFDWALAPVILALSCGNYAARFLKWQYYLRTLKIRLPLSDSLIIFMSGLGLSITPSKVGEVVRSWFLKRGFDVPVARSAPIVLADRLSDLMALVLLCALGVYSYHYGHAVVWGVAALVAAVFVVVTVRPLGTALLKRLENAPGVGKQRMVHVEQLYDSSAELLNWRRVAVPLLLAVVAWGCEGAGFYLTLAGLGLHLGILVAVFIYAFSTIVGAITLLPGGIGTTEGALAGLLKLLGITTATAALAAIIIRAATLWFGVGVGAIFLIVAEKRYGGKERTGVWKLRQNGG